MLTMCIHCFRMIATPTTIYFLYSCFQCLQSLFPVRCGVKICNLVRSRSSEGQSSKCRTSTMPYLYIYYSSSLFSYFKCKVMLCYVMLSSTNESFLMHTGTDFLAFLEQTKTLQLPSCSTGSDGVGGKKHRTE